MPEWGRSFLSFSYCVTDIYDANGGDLVAPDRLVRDAAATVDDGILGDGPLDGVPTVEAADIFLRDLHKPKSPFTLSNVPADLSGEHFSW